MKPALSEREGFAAFVLRMRSLGMTDQRLMTAFEATSRMAFVSGNLGTLAYGDRDTVEGKIGKHGQRIVQRTVKLALFFFSTLQEDLDFGDFGLQTVGRGLVLGAHGLADLLGGGIAAFLRVLQLGDMLTTLLVQLDQAGRLRLDAPFRQSCVKRLRILADPFDVEHGNKAVLKCSLD